MRGFKFSVLEVIGLLIGVVGLFGITLFKDGLIKALGGFTPSQYEAASTKTVGNSPYYTLKYYQNLSKDSCARVVDATAASVSNSNSTWASNSTSETKYGRSLVVSTSDGEVARGDLACFYVNVTESKDDYMTLIVFTVLVPNGASQISQSALANKVENSILASLPVGTLSGVPSPFEYNLDRNGRFQLRQSYRGEEIVILGLDSQSNEVYSIDDLGYLVRGDLYGESDPNAVVVVPIPDDPTIYP